MKHSRGCQNFVVNMQKQVRLLTSLTGSTAADQPQLIAYPPKVNDEQLNISHKRKMKFAPARDVVPHMTLKCLLMKRLKMNLLERQKTKILTTIRSVFVQMLEQTGRTGSLMRFVLFNKSVVESLPKNGSRLFIPESKAHILTMGEILEQVRVVIQAILNHLTGLDTFDTRNQII